MPQRRAKSKKSPPSFDHEDVPIARPVYTEKLLEERQNHLITRSLDQTPSGVSPSKAKQETTFEDLFAPPSSLSTPQGFEETLLEGKSRKKLVLVNIQKADVFESHRLNRDVWRGESVQEIISASFLFWQRQHTTPDGQTFTQLYKVTEFPYVGVLDPRTGRQMKHWPSKRLPDEFAAISEFISLLEGPEARAFCLNFASTKLVHSHSSQPSQSSQPIKAHQAPPSRFQSDSSLDFEFEEPFEIESDEDNLGQTEGQRLFDRDKKRSHLLLDKTSDSRRLDRSLSPHLFKSPRTNRSASAKSASQPLNNLGETSEVVPFKDQTNSATEPATSSSSQCSAYVPSQSSSSQSSQSNYVDMNQMLKQLHEDRIRRLKQIGKE